MTNKKYNKVKEFLKKNPDINHKDLPSVLKKKITNKAFYSLKYLCNKNSDAPKKGRQDIYCDIAVIETNGNGKEMRKFAQNIVDGLSRRLKIRLNIEEYANPSRLAVRQVVK